RTRTTAIENRTRVLTKSFFNVIQRLTPPLPILFQDRCCKQAITLSISTWDRLTRKVPSSDHCEIVGGKGIFRYLSERWSFRRSDSCRTPLLSILKAHREPAHRSQSGGRSTVPTAIKLSG